LQAYAVQRTRFIRCVEYQAKFVPNSRLLWTNDHYHKIFVEHDDTLLDATWVEHFFNQHLTLFDGPSVRVEFGMFVSNARLVECYLEPVALIFLSDKLMLKSPVNINGIPCKFLLYLLSVPDTSLHIL